MIPGLSMDTLLLVHVSMSLIAIATGLVAMVALAFVRFLPGWQAVFLATTAGTSITGFLFPFSGITPAFGFGVASRVALGIACLALPRRSTDHWTRIAYAVSATTALYLNVFVLIVQAFQTMPWLQPLAPTQSEPPFVIAQIAVLAIHLVIGWFASQTSRRADAREALSTPSL